MNRKISATLMMAAAAFLSTAGTAQARPPIGIGPRLGVELDDGNPAIGVEGRFSIFQLAPIVRLDVRASVDYYFIDAPSGTDVTLLQNAGDALFAFDVKTNILEPYGLVGLSIIWTRVSVDVLDESDSELDVGLNLGGGVKFLPKGRIQPFAETRITISDGNLFWFGGGVLFVI